MANKQSWLVPLPASPPATSPAVRASMKGNRSASTEPEMIMRKALVDLAIDHFVPRPPLLGTPDIAFERERVAVFVHGCYWHRCPYCSPHFPSSNTTYWTAKFARNRARDKKVGRQLKEDGWCVVVAWECKVRKNPTRQARRILSALSKSHS